MVDSDFPKILFSEKSEDWDFTADDQMCRHESENVEREKEIRLISPFLSYSRSRPVPPNFFSLYVRLRLMVGLRVGLSHFFPRYSLSILTRRRTTSLHRIKLFRLFS